MRTLVKPTISGELYDPAKCVRIADRYQMFLYVKHGAYPRDIYVIENDMVMVFDKESTRDLYEKWRRHELQ